MYGGGFATIPAYLRDMFGAYHVSAIHGRLLTAWSIAGVLGPVLVNYMREYQLAHGADKAGAYQTVLELMAGLLVVGLVANMLVRPVAEKYWLAEGNRSVQARDQQSAGAGGGTVQWQGRR
jgi:MFS family permease